MGQLDAVEINELFFLGLLCSILPSYLSADIEATIENVKPYIYSSVASVLYQTNKFKKFNLVNAVADFPDRAQVKSWGVFNPSKVIKITRPIDNIVLWWASPEENMSDKILKQVKSRYGWE